MSTGSPATAPATLVLHLSDLQLQHPNAGVSLFHLYAPLAAVRLANRPGNTNRRITVRWLPRDYRKPEVEEDRVLDWSACLGLWANDPDALAAAVPEQTRTEFAAIAVMAVLIADLEGAEIERPLPIGSGGDYTIIVRKVSRRFQTEVSGVGVDRGGHETAKRVRKKSAQVLKRQPEGFVSVTTFDFKTAVVLSQLAFVKKGRKRRK